MKEDPDSAERPCEFGVKPQGFFAWSRGLYDKESGYKLGGGGVEALQMDPSAQWLYPLDLIGSGWTFAVSERFQRSCSLRKVLFC